MGCGSAMLFRPAVTLMNRLGLPQKFLLICLLFVLPLSFVMWQLLSKFHSEVDQANLELLGNAYLKPAASLLRHVAEHEALVSGLGAEQLTVDQRRTNILARQTAIDVDLAELDRLNQTMGRSLNVGNALEVVKAD